MDSEVKTLFDDTTEVTEMTFKMPARFPVHENMIGFTSCKQISQVSRVDKSFKQHNMTIKMLAILGAT